MLSRSAVANYAAGVIIKGDESARQRLVERLAAWLKVTGRSRQYEYMVMDIAKALSEKGYTTLTITSARPLETNAKQAINDYLNLKFGKDNKFEIIEITDERLVGGVLIDTPIGILDLTVKNKLMTIIKGASV